MRGMSLRLCLSNLFVIGLDCRGQSRAGGHDGHTTRVCGGLVFLINVNLDLLVKGGLPLLSRETGHREE